MNRCRILVTGGAGFIGYRYVLMLLAGRAADGISVTVLDALTYASDAANLADVADDPRFDFVCGDICDRAVVDRLAARHDHIVNFAAESHVDRSILDSAPFIRTGALGLQCLLDAAVHQDVQTFTQISTDEVYGSVTTGSCTEDAPLRPTSPYAAAKAAGDLLALSTITPTAWTYGSPDVATTTDHASTRRSSSPGRSSACSTAGRSRCTVMVAMCGTGSTWTTTSVPSSWSAAAEPAARSTTSAPTSKAATARSPNASSAPAAPPPISSSTSLTVRSMTDATRSIGSKSKLSSATGPASTSAPAWPRPWPGTETTVPGGNPLPVSRSMAIKDRPIWEGRLAMSCGRPSRLSSHQAWPQQLTDQWLRFPPLHGHLR